MALEFAHTSIAHDRFHQRVHHRCGEAFKLDRGGHKEFINTSAMEQRNVIFARLRPMLANAKLPMVLFLLRCVVAGLNLKTQHAVAASSGSRFELRRYQ